MKRIVFALSWLLLSVGVLLTTTASYLVFFSTNEENIEAVEEPVVLAASTQTIENFTAPPSNGVEPVVEFTDSRASIVAGFLARHNSPLTPHEYFGAKFVEIADTYDIDFRLLPAIAMQESNLCKRTPPGTHNCLGFGIHERGTLGFESYEQGFDRAARELKERYIDIGLTTPEDIMTKYTPSSNGSWAASVNQWMAEMRYDDRQLGRELKENADVLEFVGEKSTQSDQL